MEGKIFYMQWLNNSWNLGLDSSALGLKEIHAWRWAQCLIKLSLHKTHKYWTKSKENALLYSIVILKRTARGETEVVLTTVPHIKINKLKLTSSPESRCKCHKPRHLEINIHRRKKLELDVALYKVGLWEPH